MHSEAPEAGGIESCEQCVARATVPDSWPVPHLTAHESGHKPDQESGFLKVLRPSFFSKGFENENIENILDSM